MKKLYAFIDQWGKAHNWLFWSCMACEVVLIAIGIYILNEKNPRPDAWCFCRWAEYLFAAPLVVMAVSMVHDWRKLALLFLLPFAALSQEYKIDYGTYTHSLTVDGQKIHTMVQDVFDSTNLVQDEWYQNLPDIRWLIHTTRASGPQTFHRKSHSTLVWPANGGRMQSNYWVDYISAPLPFQPGISVGQWTKVVSNRVHTYTAGSAIHTWYKSHRCPDGDDTTTMVFLFREGKANQPRASWFIPAQVSLTNGQHSTNYIPAPTSGYWHGMAMEFCRSCGDACWDFHWDPPSILWRRPMFKDANEPVTQQSPRIAMGLRASDLINVGMLTGGIVQISVGRRTGVTVELLIDAPPRSRYLLQESIGSTSDWHNFQVRDHPLGDGVDSVELPTYEQAAFYRASPILERRRHGQPTPGPYTEGPPAFLPSPIDD